MVLRMSREQKLEWLRNATTLELLDQLERLAMQYGCMNDRYGCFDERVKACKEDGDLTKEELVKRLSDK